MCLFGRFQPYQTSADDVCSAAMELQSLIILSTFRSFLPCWLEGLTLTVHSWPWKWRFSRHSQLRIHLLACSGAFFIRKKATVYCNLNSAFILKAAYICGCAKIEQAPCRCCVLILKDFLLMCLITTTHSPKPFKFSRLLYFHDYFGFNFSKAQRIVTESPRSLMLIPEITLHNFHSRFD